MQILFLLLYFLGIILMGAGGFFFGMQNSTLGIILFGVGLLLIVAGAFVSSLPRKNVKKKGQYLRFGADVTRQRLKKL